MSSYFKDIKINNINIRFDVTDDSIIKKFEIFKLYENKNCSSHIIRYSIKSENVIDFIDLVISLEENGLDYTNSNKNQKFSIIFDENNKKELKVVTKNNNIITTEYSILLGNLSKDDKELLLFSIIECIRKGLNLGIEKSKELMLKHYNTNIIGENIDINKNLSVKIFDYKDPVNSGIIDILTFKNMNGVVFELKSPTLTSEKDISRFIDSISFINDKIEVNNVMINTFVTISNKQKKIFKEKLKRLLINNLCKL